VACHARLATAKTEKTKNWFNNLVASPPLTPPIFFNKLLIFWLWLFFLFRWKRKGGARTAQPLPIGSTLKI
jgi:hypothetical protein